MTEFFILWKNKMFHRRSLIIFLTCLFFSKGGNVFAAYLWLPRCSLISEFSRQSQQFDHISAECLVKITKFKMSNASLWDHHTGFSWEGSCSNVGGKTNIGILKFEFWCKLKTQNFRSHITITTSHNLARLPHRSSCFLWKCWLRHMLRHIQRHRKPRVSRTKVFFLFCKGICLFQNICVPSSDLNQTSCTAPGPNAVLSSSRFASSRIQWHERDVFPSPQHLPAFTLLVWHLRHGSAKTVPASLK